MIELATAAATQASSAGSILQNVAIALAASAATGIFSYALARRQFSGGVRTSEAATLWSASESIREDLTEELVRSRSYIKACEAESTQKDKVIVRQAGRITQLTGLIEELKGDPVDDGDADPQLTQ